MNHSLDEVTVLGVEEGSEDAGSLGGRIILI